MAVKRYEHRKSLARLAHMNGELVRHPHLVIAQERTGSSFLVSLLNSLSGVQNVGEIMNPKLVQGLRRGRKLSWEVRRHLTNSLDAIDQPFCGAKILLSQMEFSRLTPARVASWVPGVKVILLYRSRQLEQYVSRLTALETGLWQLRTNAERTPSPSQLHVDPGDYRDFADDTRSRYEGLVAELTRLEISFVPVSYESLADTPTWVFENKICPFLGAPLGTLTSHLAKMAATPLSARIRNFEEVAHLADVEWLPSWDAEERSEASRDQ